ncbi:tetratricopeptide repeat protein [Marinomonas flavescens]|uniref:tetratricopeptide repeat protein n=1 Tax=Marinomonas flavescens TaxID=2529379 RepID=UPI0010566F48|nr:tetratricopeptide repeat protein [Marinomonas flavescens]
MQYWERLTREANKAYFKHAFSDAVDLNRKALAQVERESDHGFYQDPETIVSATVVSHLNIAEAFTGLGDFVSANLQYENAMNFLQAVLMRSDLEAEQRDLIMRTTTHIRFEWDLFIQSKGAELKTQNNALVQAITHSVSYAKAVICH